MLSHFGNLLLVSNLVITLSILYYAGIFLYNNSKVKFVNIKKLILFQLTITITSFLALLFAFVITDLSVISVYNYSHISKPIFYKISGTWGNHEGSLMLWVLILVIFSFLFYLFNSKNVNFRVSTLFFQNILILGFLVFLIINSNPFEIIKPVPTEGLGLNPILQDPALAIHPPLLYLGFVGSSIYFSAAMASLITGYSGKDFAISIKPWIIFSWVFQTLGIIVGSIWAYYELGWGGFWFWDPVENASLMPWFVMAALVHSVIVLEKRNALYAWVVVLCLLTFILSVTGTFLVRSGILNSVHTFASDSDRGVYILSFLSLMILSSFVIFFRNINFNNKSVDNNNKMIFILTNNWFMIFYLITVLIGTIYPIFTEVFYATKISVGPPYYNILIIPVLIPFLVLMAFGPESTWNKNSFVNFKKLLIVFLIAIAINILLFLFLKKFSVLTNLILISSLFLIIYSLIDVMKVFKKNLIYKLPRTAAHLGFGLLILFIGLNHNLSEEFDFNLRVGEVKKLDNYEINFNTLEVYEKKNYKTLVGNFKIKISNSNEIRSLKPEIRIYDKPETITYEASIKTNFAQDYFLTMSNIGDGDIYNIKFQRKPLMLWIWLSAFLISIGGLYRLFYKS